MIFDQPILSTLKNYFRLPHSTKRCMPFSVMFRNFKNILQGNNSILDLLADMGEKLGGESILDRQYITDVFNRMSDVVFRLISDLSVLTRSDNAELFAAFERIRREILERLSEDRAPLALRSAAPHAIPLSKVGAGLLEQVGNKFANLGEIRNGLGLETPDGFAVTTKAFFDFMTHNDLLKYIEDVLAHCDWHDEAAFEAMCEDVRERILKGSIPENMLSEITAMLEMVTAKRGGGPARFAVRSSAWDEDSENSFAGQYESVLNVPADGVLDACRQVIASAYTPEAWLYRLHRSYKEHEMAMAIGCQAMVDAEVSGAMYSCSPLPTNNSAMVISAAWGLGPAVVQGSAESDTFMIERRPPHDLLSAEIKHKSKIMRPGPQGGTFWEDVPEKLRDAACLSAEQLQRLGQAAVALEHHFEQPQDLEWAFDHKGDLFILQSRPLNIKPEPVDAAPGIDAESIPAEVIFAEKGTVVQRGIGVGKVYLSHRDEDLKEFPPGAILVARYTSPKYVRVMLKAHGIITDVGSPTGHMTALAREYGVPTIVGAEIATSVLKAGDEITLDANRNVVYRGTVTQLDHFEPIEQEVFKQSYEYRLLRRLVREINQLNLVDPSGSNFKPEQCRTFHDITRYAHEKAVEALVDLSGNYAKYHASAPKRLQSNPPLGLTVVDIEDGVSGPRNARTATADQIMSVPLKAFLEGLSQPGMWSTDPAPMGAGSLMSSIARSLASPQPVAGKSCRNLVVISREYMNLSIRLGYHFTMVDAYIGDATNDNYIYFRFLGGMADLIRRSRRGRFIARVLDHLDFNVEMHGDLVVGRVKKMSREEMSGKMKVVGRLIGYSRQLDVSMNSDESVTRCFEEFLEGTATSQDGP